MERMYESIRYWLKTLPAGFRWLFVANSAMALLQIPALLFKDVYEHIGVLHFPMGWLTPLQFLLFGFVNPWFNVLGLIGFLFAMTWLYLFADLYQDLYQPYRVVALYVLGSWIAGAAYLMVGQLGGAVSMQGGLFGSYFGTVAIAFAFIRNNPGFKVNLFFVPVPIWILGVLLMIIAQSPFIIFSAAMGWGFSEALRNGVDFGKPFKPFFTPYGLTLPKDLFRRKMPVQTPVRMPSAGTRPAQKPPLTRTYAQPVAPKRPAPQPPKPEMLDPQAEVDRILDKINAQGYGSLTAEEKQRLYDASQQ